MYGPANRVAMGGLTYWRSNNSIYSWYIKPATAPVSFTSIGRLGDVWVRQAVFWSTDQTRLPGYQQA